MRRRPSGPVSSRSSAGRTWASHRWSTGSSGRRSRSSRRLPTRHAPVSAESSNDPSVAVNKPDRASPATILSRLHAAEQTLELADAEYFPISALTGDGVGELVETVVARLPPGPGSY